MTMSRSITAALAVLDELQLRDRASAGCIASLSEIIERETGGGADRGVAPAPATVDLIRTRIAAVRAAFGAPGDYGYDSPQGQALYDLYRLGAEMRP